MAKVCILAAGLGSRVSFDAPKAILPVDNKAVLSHIFSYFPEDTSFVIAVGCRDNVIREFVSLVHPDKDVTFVQVDHWQGEGSGPGWSLLQCRDYLQEPFYFISSDTLICEQKIPSIDKNWIGVTKVKDAENYLVVKEDDYGLITKFIDKKYSNNPEQAFIGFAGIWNYELFWKSLEQNSELKAGEYQVSNGLEGLLPELVTYLFKYYDTGTTEKYEKALKAFNKFDFLPKPGEFLYFENGEVIKYFSDKKVVTGRVKRAKLLKGVVPNLTESTRHFYKYKYIEGERISHIPCEPHKYEELLGFCQEMLWKPIDFDNKDKAIFIDGCYAFYKFKTERRVKQYLSAHGADMVDYINGNIVDQVYTLLGEVDWNMLADTSVPVLFHGDLQPENILVNKNRGFTLIDWRQDFSGAYAAGDLYYDLAKLYHALIVSGDVIRAGRYSVEGTNFNFDVRHNLMQFRRVFENFCMFKGYDIKKVRLLTALIFLNIAPLYSGEYSKLLFYLGKFTLDEVLRGVWTI